MILAELKKIKRHYLLPLSIGVVVLSCLLALIQLTGAENSVVGYLPLTDGILWNNVTLIFPFLITFFGGFLMNREYAEDTLKRNLFLAGTCGAFVYGFCGIFVANTHFTSWYPTTTGLSIIKYEPNSANYQISVSIFVLAICLFISLFIISVIRRKRDD